MYSSHQEYELWLPPGALNNFAVQFDASDAAAVNTANTLYNGGATGCCVCESGCDHSLETQDGTNGQCGLANDDFNTYYIDRPNDQTSCGTKGGEWLDGARYTPRFGYRPGSLMCDAFGPQYIVAEANLIDAFCTGNPTKTAASTRYVGIC